MDTAVVGRPIAELETPALLVARDATDRSIAAMTAEIRQRGVTRRGAATC